MFFSVVFTDQHFKEKSTENFTGPKDLMLHIQLVIQYCAQGKYLNQNNFSMIYERKKVSKNSSCYSFLYSNRHIMVHICLKYFKTVSSQSGNPSSLHTQLLSFSCCCVFYSNAIIAVDQAIDHPPMSHGRVTPPMLLLRMNDIGCLNACFPPIENRILYHGFSKKD